MQGRSTNPLGDDDTIKCNENIKQTKEWRKIDNNDLYSIVFPASNDGAQKLAERYERKLVDHGSSVAGGGRNVHWHF